MSWQQIPLPDAFWFQEGPGLRKWQFHSDGIKVLNVGNIMPDGSIDLSRTDRHISEEEFTSKYSHFSVDVGDLVIASSGISFDPDGFLRTKVGFIEAAHLPLCMNTSTIRFKAVGGFSHLPYLKHWFQSNEFRQQVSQRVTGSAQLNFGPSHLKSMEISLPLLEEQRRIAAILDQADALRRLRRHALDRLNTLGQAIFHEMFGDPATSGETGLGDVLLASGNGMNTPQDDTGEGVPVTRIETIWNGTIDASRVKWSTPDPEKAERHFLKPGDILFSHINSPDHIAKSAIYEGEPSPLLHGINLLRLQPNRESVDPHWILYLLKSKTVRDLFCVRCKKAVNQASLNQKNLKELNFELPKIDLQREFRDKISSAKCEIGNFETSSKQIENLFITLQYRAFHGEL